LQQQQPPLTDDANRKTEQARRLTYRQSVAPCTIDDVNSSDAHEATSQPRPSPHPSLWRRNNSSPRVAERNAHLLTPPRDRLHYNAGSIHAERQRRYWHWWQESTARQTETETERERERERVCVCVCVYSFHRATWPVGQRRRRQYAYYAPRIIASEGKRKEKKISVRSSLARGRIVVRPPLGNLNPIQYMVRWAKPAHDRFRRFCIVCPLQHTDHATCDIGSNGPQLAVRAGNAA